MRETFDIPAEEAWAVVDGDGRINPRTVCDSERGAKVNWIFSAENVFVRRGTTDEQIDRMWQELAPNRGVEVMRIAIIPLARFKALTGAKP